MNEKGVATKNLLATTLAGNPDLNAVRALAGAETSEGLNFTFEYSGYLFAVRASAGQQNTQIRFHANLGSLPYTAENSEARHHAMAVLRAASRMLGGRVRLTPQQRILLQENVTIDEPLTPVTLMSRTAMLLIMAKPYLELLTRFVHPPANA